MDLFIDGIIKCEKKLKWNQVKDKNVPKKQWITRALLKSCKKRDKLHKQLKKDPMNESLQREYKNYVKCLNKVIKDAKIKYEKDLIEKKLK